MRQRNEEMIAPLVLFALIADEPPTLAEVEARVRTMPGVTIASEMQSPSVVPIEFKIGREGRFWAKYPTSEMYISVKETITWMADRKEYAKAPNTEGNPLPVGFHTLWPGAQSYRQIGLTEVAKFFGQDCFKITCQGSEPYSIDLFIDQSTKLPKGTRVQFNGTTYEMLYKSVKVGAIDPKLFIFQPPQGSKPAGGQNPDLKLIKPGAKLDGFAGVDLKGRALSAATLKKQFPKGLILNFWFSSCVGCVEEMPFLVKLHPKLAKLKIGLVGVNPVDKAQIAQRTAAKNQLGYPTLSGAGADSLRRRVSVEVYPVTVVLGPDHTVVDAFAGFDERRLTSALKQLGASL